MELFVFQLELGLWEVSDIVRVLEQYEAECVTEPTFDIERQRIGCGCIVRVTFPNGETEAIYNNFKTREDAINWIRCEAVVWLYDQRKLQNKKSRA